MSPSIVLANVLVSLFAHDIQSPEPPASLSWSIGVVKEARLGDNGGDSYGPGIHLLLAAQAQVEVSIALGNRSGPEADISGLLERVRLSITQEGRDIPISIERTLRSANPSPAVLAKDEGVHMWFVIQRTDETPFEAAAYVIAVSMADAARSIKTGDGQPWTGYMKVADQRRIIVRDPSNREEMLVFLQEEGNHLLSKGRASEALEFLQPLAAELPDDWQAQGALGRAYWGTRQYALAATAFERALPGWLKFPDRRSDVITNSLARAYLALKRDADAAQVLRSVGVPEADILPRLATLRQSIGHDDD